MENNVSEVVTGIFQSTAQQYINRCMRLWLAKYAWVLVIVFGICGCMAVVRREWLIVALILLFIVYPFVLATVFFNYGMKPEATRFLRPMTVTIGDNVRLQYYNRHEDLNSGTTEYISADSETFEYRDIKRVRAMSKDLLIEFRNPKFATVCIKDENWVNADEKWSACRLFEENGIRFA